MAQPFRDGGAITAPPFRDEGAITAQPFRDGGLSLHSHAEMNMLTPTRLKLQTYLCKTEWVHVDFLLERV